MAYELEVSKEQLLDRALLLLDKERDRLDQIDITELLYTDVGVFESSDDVDVLITKVPDGRDVVDMVSDLLGATELSILVPAPGELVKDKKRAESVERWLSAYMVALDQYEDTQYVASAVWDQMVRGAFVARAIINTEAGDDELPVLLQLRDYRNVLPVWRGSRLVEVFEAYEIQVIDLRLEYPDIDFPKEWNDDEIVTCFEYWSCTHKAFWTGFIGEGVRHIKSTGAGGGAVWLQEPTEHNYGVLPYSIRIPRGMNRTGHSSILGKMSVTLKVMSKLESAFLTTAVGSVMSGWTLHSERGAEALGALDLRFNKVNVLEPDEVLAPIVRPPMPSDVPVAMEAWGERLQKQSFPDAAWGKGVGSQMSGYAIAILQQSGTRILSPLVDTIEKGTSDVLGIVLSILENVVIPHDDEVAVSYFDDDEGFWVESALTASDIEGVRRVHCSLSDPTPQDQDRAMGAASAMRQPDATGRPMLSTETIYTKILQDVVDDPAVEAARIDAERMASALVDTLTQDVVQKLQQTLMPPPPPEPPPQPPPEEMPPEEPLPPPTNIPQEMPLTGPIPVPDVMPGMEGMMPTMPPPGMEGAGMMPSGSGPPMEEMMPPGVRLPEEEMPNV